MKKPAATPVSLPLAVPAPPPAGSPAAQSIAATRSKIAPLLAYARKVLATSQEPITEQTALYLILQVCMQESLTFELHEVNDAVRLIMIEQNKVIDTGYGHVLTWGALRKIGDQLPDNTPVVFERIEDAYFANHGWQTRSLPWETTPARPGLDPDLEKEPHELLRYVDIDGVRHLQQLTKYIDAFSAYVAEDDQGHRALCVHAHY